jgi:hypothetical protein
MLRRSFLGVSMKRIALFPYLTLCLIAGSVAYGKSVPDSCRVIILSDSVGEVISAAAGERYDLFRQFKGFKKAVILELPDSSCAFLFTFASGTGLRDTLVRSTWPAIITMAEKIEHFQELENGEYVMGSSPPHMRYSSPGLTGSAEFIPPGGFNSAPAVLSWMDTEAPGADSLRFQWGARITHQAADPLPLAWAPGLKMPRRYPHIAVAVGLRTISPDLSGLRGGAIGSNKVFISPLFNIVTELVVTEEIGIQVDWGHSSFEYNTAGATLVFYTHPFDDPEVRPFLEAGGVWTSVHTGLSGAGDPVIYMQAASGGVRAGIGVEYIPDNSVVVVLDVSYEYVAKKSDAFVDYSFYSGGQYSTIPIVTPVSVDLSSVRFGIRIKFQ